LTSSKSQEFVVYAEDILDLTKVCGGVFIKFKKMHNVLSYLNKVGAAGQVCLAVYAIGISAVVHPT
jgi:hypothetical protein